MTPDFRILADRADVTEAIRKHLVMLRLTDKAGMEADQLDISVADPAGDIAIPRRGAVLSLALGWKDQPLVVKGSFTVDEVGEDGPPDVVTIVARSADFRAAIRNQRDQSYSGKTIGEILGAIAARNSLTAAIHPDLAARRIDHIDQTNESDANFVTRLGKDYDAVATIKSGRLLFVPAGTGKTASDRLLSAYTITRAAGDRHSFRATDREGTQTGVKAKWHDINTGQTAFALAGTESSSRVLKRTYPTQAEAQAAAEAAFGRQKSKSHEFSATLALGAPDLLAGAPLTLVGWRPEITELEWVAGDVVHTLDGAGGFTTEVPATEVRG